MQNFQTGNCRYGKRCRFLHEHHDKPGVIELLKRLQVATILTGMKLEDVKEIIKNQNEIIKEQASEIVKLKTSLENILICRSNEASTSPSTANRHTQCCISTSDKYTNTDDSFFHPLPKKTEDHPPTNKLSLDENIQGACVRHSSAEKTTMVNPAKA